MALRLIIEDVEGATTIVPLADDEVTIGRKGGNTIQLTEQNVSRNHARLQLIEGEWEISDLGSYNGVLVNGAPISQTTRLREGDLIQIGDYHLVLADELDKRTVDMDHPLRAANDDEPMLASSSADLPKLSEEELSALRSGPHRTVAAATDEDESPYVKERASPASKVLIGAILVGVIAGGVWLAVGEGEQDAGVAASVPAPAEDQAQPSAEPEPEPVPPPPPEPEPELAAGDGAAGDTEAAPSLEPDAPAAEDGETGEAAAEPAAAEAAAEPPESEAASPGPGPKKHAKKAAKKDDAAAPAPAKEDEAEEATVPSPPSGPARSPQQLLSDARKASLAGDAATAYELAKEAYQVGKGQDALQLMGVSACKLGDATKARSAYKKLSGAKKEQLASLCSAKGIEL